MPRATPANTLTLTCPAKVNLALAVGPADPDRHGFHPIASWMIALDFGDRLTLHRLAGGERSTYQRTFADDAPAPQPIDWPLERDLAVRAHHLLEQHTGRTLPVALRVDKRVPAGAGLAGGSADAAATLVGLDRLFDLELGDAALRTLASELGCDTAFATAALTAHARSALVTGLGEQLELLPLSKPVHLAIVLPPFTCPTGSVYHHFDQLPAHRPFERQSAHADALARRGESLDQPLFNDLEPAAVAAQPRLSALLTTLRDDLELPAHLTGSGSAVFVVTPSASAARAVARTIAQATSMPVVTARSLTAHPNGDG